MNVPRHSHRHCESWSSPNSWNFEVGLKTHRARRVPGAERTSTRDRRWPADVVTVTRDSAPRLTVTRPAARRRFEVDREPGYLGVECRRRSFAGGVQAQWGRARAAGWRGRRRLVRHRVLAIPGRGGHLRRGMGARERSASMEGRGWRRTATSAICLPRCPTRVREHLIANERAVNRLQDQIDVENLERSASAKKRR